MGNMRFDDKRWQELTNKELELTIKAGKFIKKSQMINHIVDNYLKYIDYKDGKIIFNMEPKKE